MEKVVFTFGWEEKDHPIPPGSTTVEITLHPEGDKTRVRLVHRGLPADAVERPRQRVGALPRAAGVRAARRRSRSGPRTGRRRLMDLVKLHDRALRGDDRRSSPTSTRHIRRADAVRRVRRPHALLNHMIGGNYRFVDDQPWRAGRGRAGDGRLRATTTRSRPIVSRPSALSKGMERAGGVGAHCAPAHRRRPGRDRPRASTRSRRSCTVGTWQRQRDSRPSSTRSCTRWRGRTPRASMTASAVPVGRSVRRSWPPPAGVERHDSIDGLARTTAVKGDRR